ncbi:NAD-dependent epimerase/dehydratase family protein [Mycobacterium sp.]|uniref:NAD-dependent epimerase/dehydratase family protein n=1 Tax=Mycobacterium sp. TaxID=1785 RepID=UPI002F19E8DC
MTAFVTGGSGFIGGRLIERLVADGVGVRALARSDRAAAAVEARGAEAVRGDLADVDAITAGAQGCDTAYHLAANVEMWGAWDDFVRDNVTGTQNVLAATKAAGVARFVHCGTEAALIAGEPLRNVDETAPLRPDSPAPYAATKARAEQEVRAANRDGFETVVVRPRFVWGAGDTTLLPSMVEMVKSGRFAWIGGGKQLTDVTHVDNVVEGLLLGARNGRGGDAYFVTDGEPVIFREFVSALLETQGVAAPSRSIPTWVAGPLAAACEGLWRATPLPGQPPLTRFTYWVSSQECTIDIGKARRELGYRPIKGRAAGLAELGRIS